MILVEKLNKRIPEWRERISNLVREYGHKKVGEVTIAQIYGGMRDVKSMVTDISYVDPDEGIRLRSYTIPEIIEKLPKCNGSEMPLVGGLYHLLLLGELPTEIEALEVESKWKELGDLPHYVYDVLNSMPANASPMTMFSQAILAMQGESQFTKKYNEGMRKDDYWKPMLDDSLSLIAKLPAVAAYIYNLRSNKREKLYIDSNLDWAGNFGEMMGILGSSFHELSRLYMVIHSDHESGNVSAHTTHLVASALSDIYYAASAAMNGLAGPLHGGANHETLHWLLTVYDKYHGVLTKEELREFALQTLSSGKVIPGYGHAVLRKTDPRFTVLYEFGKKYFPDDGMFRLASLVYDVVPTLLMEHGKAKNPWPNVDAMSGALLYHYGIKDHGGSVGCGFYTVMFGMSRILGVSANAVWARALNQPLERPKSLTTPMLEAIARNSREPHL
jgi:citrate synthase